MKHKYIACPSCGCKNTKAMDALAAKEKELKRIMGIVRYWQLEGRKNSYSKE